MPQMTSRDEAMLDWMNIVRLADVDAIRWALAAYQGDHEYRPVSIRRANYWIARMAKLGYLERTRPVYRDRQIVWPTPLATGRPAPRLFRQTMRHELAVAGASARYLKAGFEWGRDRRPLAPTDHQGDGVATKAGIAVLVEVELTSKALPRYRAILASHALRIETSELSRVRYLCTDEVSRTIVRQADRFMFRDQRGLLDTHVVYDVEGRWLPAEYPESVVGGI